MFEDVYVPNKLRNQKLKEVCFDIVYVRNYYKKDELLIEDKSNPYIPKVDLGTIKLYFNGDQTTDICIYGPGLWRELSFFQSLIALISQ